METEKKFKVAYKKVRILKDGRVYPLFIDKRRPFTFGEWMESEFHPTKGFAPRTIDGDMNDPSTCCGGWHCTPAPKADWIADKLASGEKRVWMVVLMDDWVEYDRQNKAQGKWYLAKRIKPLGLLTNGQEREVAV